MQAVAEKLMQSSNNHVTTLPAVVRKSVPVASSVKSDLRVKSMKSRYINIFLCCCLLFAVAEKDQAFSPLVCHLGRFVW